MLTNRGFPGSGELERVGLIVHSILLSGLKRLSGDTGRRFFSRETFVPEVPGRLWGLESSGREEGESIRNLVRNSEPIGCIISSHE